MKNYAFFIITLNLIIIARGSAKDLTPIVDNPHVQMLNFDLTIPNNDHFERQYDLNKTDGKQVLSKKIVNTYKYDQSNHYKISLVKNGDQKVLDEFQIKDWHVGTQNTLSTSRFEGSNLVSKTKCEQSLHANSHPFSISDERVNCITYTKRFCELFKNEITRDGNSSDPIYDRENKGVSIKKVQECSSVFSHLFKRLQNISKKISPEDVNISNNDMSRLKKAGYEMSKEYFSPIVVWNNEVETMNTLGTTNKKATLLQEGFKGMYLVESTLAECAKLEPFFKSDTSKRAKSTKSKSRSTPN